MHNRIILTCGVLQPYKADTLADQWKKAPETHLVEVAVRSPEDDLRGHYVFPGV